MVSRRGFFASIAAVLASPLGRTRPRVTTIDVSGTETYTLASSAEYPLLPLTADRRAMVITPADLSGLMNRSGIISSNFGRLIA